MSISGNGNWLFAAETVSPFNPSHSRIHIGSNDLYVDNLVGESINDVGQVTGRWQTDVHALGVPGIWQGGVWTPLENLTNIGEINNLGHALGWSNSHAVLWRPEGLVDIGDISLCALNGRDQAVGYSGMNGMLWDPILGSQTLDSLIDPALGLHITQALDINDSGAILAITSSNSYVLLSPVPEPSSLLAFFAGAGLVGMMLKRRR